MVKGYSHMSADEVRLAKQWRADGVSIPKIAERLGRSKGTVSKRVAKGNVKTKPKGSFASALLIA